jgi:hypothetical protein
MRFEFGILGSISHKVSAIYEESGIKSVIGSSNGVYQKHQFDDDNSDYIIDRGQY